MWGPAPRTQGCLVVRASKATVIEQCTHHDGGMSHGHDVHPKRGRGCSGLDLLEEERVEKKADFGERGGEQGAGAGELWATSWEMKLWEYCKQMQTATDGVSPRDPRGQAEL